MNAVNSKVDYFNVLNDLLNKQIASLQTAAAYLNDIKVSIETNNLESLQQLIKHNDIPLSRIEEQESERFAVIEACGYEKNKTGFKQCIESFDDDNKTLTTLSDLLYDVMDELQMATTVSDLLITKNKNRVKQSLSILTGTTLKKDHTYSSTGKANPDDLKRNLAIA